MKAEPRNPNLADGVPIAGKGSSWSLTAVQIQRAPCVTESSSCKARARGTGPQRPEFTYSDAVRSHGLRLATGQVV